MMFLQTFLRSPSLAIRPNIVQKALRSFSSGPYTLTNVAQANSNPDWVQHSALAAEREHQWKKYRRARNLRRFAALGIFTTVFVIGKNVLGNVFDASERNFQVIDEKLAKLPQVRQLLEDAATRSLRDTYAEINLDKRVPSTLTDHTLNSNLLLGPKRAFWSHSQKELLFFQWFGMFLSGWPSVVHGGAVATAMSEAMSRAAACIEPTAGITCSSQYQPTVD